MSPRRYVAAIGFVLAAVLVGARPASGSDAGSPTTAAPAALTDADAAALLVDDPGDGWQRRQLAGAGATTATFVNGARILQIQVVAHPSCATASVDPRLPLIATVSGSGSQLVADDGRIARFAADFPGTAVRTAIFDTQHATFMVELHGEPAEAPAMEADLVRLVQVQSARDGGIVASRYAAAGNRAAAVLLDRSPIPGFVGPIASGATFAACGPEANTVLRYIASHAEERVGVFVGPADLAVTVDVVRYPFELMAAAVGGAPFSSMVRLAPAGLDLPAGAAAYARRDEPGVVFVVFRRERYAVMVMAKAGEGLAVTLAVRFAIAQAARLPNGPIGTYRFPSPLASVATSSALVLVLGASLLLVRRLRAGSVRRRPISLPPPGPGPRVVDVGHQGAAMRHRGAWLVAAQLGALATIFVGLAADIGTARWLVAAVGVAIAVLVTMWVRRRDEGHRGPLARRHPRPSGGGAAVGIAAIAATVVGGALMVRGLQEVAFAPSLTHLLLADRLSVEPRRLAWLMATLGVVVVFAGVVLVRTARSLARVGWRRAGVDAAPVVYLRSFHDDDIALPCVCSARRPWIEVLGLRAREPFEEAMAWELATYGPVIAIGRPGRSRASLGAVREHLADGAWQRVIADRLAAARAVVVTIGATAGLEWELAHLASAGHLGKTTFLVPPVSDADTATRWSFTSEALRRAGVVTHPATLATVPTASAITIQLDAHGGCVVHAADRRDEAAYRAALDQAVAGQLA